jgi:hypothetical protein
MQIMRGLGVVTIVVTTMCSGFMGIALGQSSTTQLEEVVEIYQTGRLEQAELAAFRLLSRDSQMTSVERSEVYRILAYIAIARDDLQSGQEYFHLALESNENLHLDRNLTSPKILSVFDEAKLNFKEVKQQREEVSASVQRSFRLRVEGGKRSILLPGLGQIHKGHNARGYTIMTATGLTASALVYSQFRYSDAKKDYDNATLPAAAASAYDDYNSWSKNRNILGVTLGVIWIGSILEAFISAPPEQAPDQQALQVGMGGPDGTPGLTLSLRF